MVNVYLYRSSLICGAIQFLFMTFYNTKLNLVIFYTIGILTSIWNHGTTSEVAKWVDRFIACMAMFVDLYCLCTLEKEMAISGSLILITGITFFFISKHHEKKAFHRDRDFFHGIFHCLATVIHLGLLYI